MSNFNITCLFSYSIGWKGLIWVGVFILDSLAIVCSVIISNKHGQRKSSTSISHAYFSTHWIEKHNLSALVLGGFVIIFDVIAWVTRRDPSKFHKLKTCQTNQQQKGSCIGLYFDQSFIDQPEKHLLTHTEFLNLFSENMPRSFLLLTKYCEA